MVDYKLLDDAVNHYSKCGFERIETPWTVSPAVDDITRPKDKTPFELKHNNKRLVASGEQSFMYLMLKGFLPLGAYQTITPCFRDDLFDDTHSKYFMKNELIITDKATEGELDLMVGTALEFFEVYFGSGACETVRDGEVFDIVLKDTAIELGSYGIREWNNFKWIYGTGCAEPRTSNLIKQYGVSQE